LIHFYKRISMLNVDSHTMLMKSPVDIKELFLRISQDTGEGRYTGYEDTKILCKDGNISSNSLLLALAFPFLEEPLALLHDLMTFLSLDVIMPDFTVTEIREELCKFYSQPETHDELDLIKCETYIKEELVDNICDFEACPQCGISSFENVEERKIHIEYCSQYRFRCSFCTDTFISKIEKRSHEKIHKTEDGKLKCYFETCQERLFNTRRGFMRHLKSVHERGKDSVHTCFFCDETFQDIANYKNHMKNYKKGPNDYRCSEVENCDFKCKSRVSLLDHLRKHRNEYPYWCEICGSSFTTKWTRVNHMKMHAPKSKPSAPCMCHICSKSFNSKSSLTHHLNSVHVDKKDYKYQCNHCPQGFPRRNELTRHMVTHTGIRNFTCTTCGQKFLTKATMEQHEKIHTGERPHKCSFCGKGFITQNKVRRHEVVHTGALDFSCSVCGKKFNQKTNRNVHERKCKGSCAEHPSKYSNLAGESYQTITSSLARFSSMDFISTTPGTFPSSDNSSSYSVN